MHLCFDVCLRDPVWNAPPKDAASCHTSWSTCLPVKHYRCVLGSGAHHTGRIFGRCIFFTNGYHCGANSRAIFEAAVRPSCTVAR